MTERERDIQGEIKRVRKKGGRGKPEGHPCLSYQKRENRHK